LAKNVFLNEFAKLQNAHVGALPQDVPVGMRTSNFIVEKQVVLDRVEQTSNIFVA
jgi:hypothetical protein